MTTSHLFESTIACSLLGKILIESDLDPAGRNFCNEEAKKAYIGFRLGDLDEDQIVEILISSGELSAFEVARLCPAVLCAAMNHPEDMWLQDKLQELKYGFWLDEIKDEFRRGLNELDEDQKLALENIINLLISRNVFLDLAGDIILTLAGLKHILVNLDLHS